ncbi:gamma-glutamyltransferase family protein [Planomonospora venezuelensis]|uniref:Gamma-glutamyltranspeptidase/glutathione hydrolase n=1 Tax=Planomonospora venezuelensis TaxID=1999 RepID=A0A841CX54_PLAVE|nr:gamma-glutamyltransferase family protein [Planomonospora venezuelensis]MBB5961980.1 gamma-glutamyltranspeptidase/glutathione hydrolase [Planomonospora venezuelensis]GIN00080.1 gamma-glutamyltranspeptidase [Planomonospora venezuelensis]
MIARRIAVPLAGILAGSSVLLTQPATAGVSPPVEKRPVAEGYGGAVSTVDPDASRAALEVLRRGGNAVDAAVAGAAVLGVTEPYSAGLAGGGFIVYYDARRKKVHTIDGRETAPRAMTSASLEGVPLDEAVTSGLSAGVPGSVAQWELALRRFGTLSLRQALQPAIRVAREGFTVDRTFHDQTAANAARFADFTSTARLFLPGGAPPPVGSTFRNPELAETYRLLGRYGGRWLYGGGLGAEIVKTVKNPPVAPGSARNVRPGLMELPDLRAYRALERPPTRTTYKGMDVYGMAPPSSGGSTVGEALNILEALPEAGMHEYLEASRLAFADRGRYVGDVPGVPLEELLSDGFAKERACLVGERAMPHPAPPGNPDGAYEPCPAADPAPPTAETPAEGPETTHLVVADRWGNVVAYNITIESTGGNGIVVPGRGFLLNNELTDFTFGPAPGDPNLPGPGKRPRSSMAPTIVLADGRPLLALGSPGGSTIITTVLQILVNRWELGMPLPEALAAPRATQRNTAQTQAEQGFIDRYGAELTARGHAFTLNPEIGAATAVEFLGRGRLQAVAEPSRRGGGSALVMIPAR